MNARHRLLAIAIASLTLAACNASPPPAKGANADPDGPKTALGRTVEHAMAEARKELATENISINNGVSIGPQSHREDTSNLPKAEITPKGDLLIEGKTVSIDAAQRALLLQYRGHVIALAESGMALGVKGADLGMQAAGAAIAGIFSGDTSKVEQHVEAEASKIEAEALQLCSGLGPMLATQRELAASLPAFAPYARMTQADVDDCMRDKDRKVVRGELRDEIRQEIRQEIRDGVRETVRDTVGASEPAANAAEEAEAASTPAR